MGSACQTLVNLRDMSFLETHQFRYFYPTSQLKGSLNLVIHNLRLRDAPVEIHMGGVGKNLLLYATYMSLIFAVSYDCMLIHSLL